MILISPHMLITPFVLWMARLRNLIQRGDELRNESLDVLQLHLAVADSRWATHCASNILCRCGCDGDCGSATGRADDQQLLYEQCARCQWRRYIDQLL